jgi:hypothetical protein
MRRLINGVLAAALLSGAFHLQPAAGATGATGAAPSNATAGAPAKWFLQHTPAVAGAALDSVSCVSATACTAIGAKVNGYIYRTVAEGWNGTNWAVEPTPKIPGGIDSFLRGVSCPAAASCTAVGYYWNGTMDVPLAESWNGTNWSIRPTPEPVGSRSSYLFGVSCSSPAACTAVGDYINRLGFGLPLAERWNGTAWSIQPAPSPPRAQQSVLLGVSCPAGRACTAVGQAAGASGASKTLAEAWNGATWSIQPTPNKPGAELNSLAGVSCATAEACTAVGNDSPGFSSTVTLAEAWNGSKWSIQPTPDSPAASDSYLSGVSCTSATACTASGYFLTHGGIDVSLAEGWNGSAWSIEPTARPLGAVDSFLDGVSCTSAIDCTAAGDYTVASSQATLVERHAVR